MSTIRTALCRLLFAAFAFPLLLGAPAHSAEHADVPIADAHVHLLDFLQNGDHLENGKIVRKRPGAALPAGASTHACALSASPSRS